jgi:hypothetical protein
MIAAYGQRSGQKRRGRGMDKVRTGPRMRITVLEQVGKQQISM